MILALVLLLSCARDQRTDRLELWGLGREGEVVAEMIPEFERRNPGIRVVIQQIPWSAAHEKLVTAHVGDSSPDVAQMGNTWVPEFAAMRALDDLGPFVAQSKTVDPRDYFPGIWATNVVDGVLHGIPWYVDTRVLFYRSDILGSVGYPNGPRTWEEWTDAMQKIASRKLARHPLLMPTNEWDPPVILGLSNGAGILTPDGTRGAFREKAWSDAFRFYISLYRNGYAPATSNAQIANLYQSFAQGEFAMYITGPWNVGEFRRRLPADMQDKWATAPMPAAPGRARGVSMAGGASLVVFRASKNKAAARKLIEFLSEPAQQVKFFELTGDLPARRSAWQSPTLNAEPSFPAFRTQLESVAPLPQVPEWEQIATAIYDRGEAAARGAVPVDAALQQLDRRADELLEKRRWIVARKER